MSSNRSDYSSAQLRGAWIVLNQPIRTGIYTIMAAVAVIVSLFGQGLPAEATPGNSPNVLKVSPVRSDIEVQPGTSKAVRTIITNLTKAPITVRPVGNDFIAGDERGTPALILDGDSFAPTHSLKRFMAPLSEVTIPASQDKVVNVVITVPKDAQAGGYFGAIRFVPTTPNSGEQVNLSGSVASLMLLKVPGDLVEKLDLTDFEIQQKSKSGAYFHSPDNLQVTVRFANKGNVQVGPFGKVSVKSGNEVVYEADFNTKDPRDMALPDGARRWDIPLEKIGTFGKYTVSATFTYGQKNQTVEVTKSFWVIPTGIVIAGILVVALLIAVFIGTWLYLRRRRLRALHGHARGGNGYKRY